MNYRPHRLPVLKEAGEAHEFISRQAELANLGKTFLSVEGRVYICAVSKYSAYTFVNLETGSTWSHDGQPLECVPVNVEITYSRL